MNLSLSTLVSIDKVRLTGTCYISFTRQEQIQSEVDQDFQVTSKYTPPKIRAVLIVKCGWRIEEYDSTHSVISGEVTRKETFTIFQSNIQELTPVLNPARYFIRTRMSKLSSPSLGFVTHVKAMPKFNSIDTVIRTLLCEHTSRYFFLEELVMSFLSASM